MSIYIFRSTGQYLGFIENNHFYSRDGESLAWIDGINVWDKEGDFRGKVTQIGNYKYILKNIYEISPVPKPPKMIPATTSVAVPQSNIPSISLSIGFKDSF